MLIQRVLTGLALLMLWTGLSAQTLTPLLTATPPAIDGKLDDSVWSQAPSVTGFKTVDPDFGQTPRNPTRVWMAHDRENLYFAFRCFDAEPHLIKTSITSRDNIQSDDWVCLNLDSFNDQQSLYAFYVNPAGIQGDSRMAGGREDASIDLVWHSAGQVDEKGYAIEIQIPLKSIRFKAGDDVAMGVIFERYVSRFSEYAMYPEMSPEQGFNFVTQSAPLAYRGLKQKRVVELLPAFTYGHSQALQSGEMKTEEERHDFSLTGKLGLTSDLILDGTVNPDFSQVEADAGQVDVNLRYALYFQEKRPFFLEGRENFIIGGMAASERDPLRQFVHTRTINNPDAGVKLTGKMGEKNTIASIYAHDSSPDHDSLDAHAMILRYKRTLAKDSFIGGLYAGRELEDGHNRVLGVDGQIRVTWSDMLEFHGFQSRCRQQNHNLDPAWALGLRFKHGTRRLDYDVSFKELSKDLKMDLGYLRRNGVRQASVLVRPKLYPAFKAVTRLDIEGYSAQTLDLYDDMGETFNHLSAQAFFLGNATLKVKYSYSTEVYQGQRFDTGGFHVFAGGQFTRDFYFGVLYRGVQSIFYAASLQGRSNILSADLVYQPSDKLNAQLGYTMADFHTQGVELYSYGITRGKLTYQLNRYLFIRGILEYNDYDKDLLSDFLLSFTYIPGTVLHVGYGSLHHKQKWVNSGFERSNQFHAYRRGFFFKASYLWRL